MEGKEIWQGGNMLYPVPAVMISCAKEGERPNIITVAWTGTVNSSPPMVFASIRPERYSYNIIKESGEFVINLTTQSLLKAADFCGVKSGRDMDKFKECRLTPQKCPHMKAAPAIKESPVNIECSVTDIISLGSHDMFLAEVIGVCVSEKYIDSKGRFDLNAAKLIAYSHGEYMDLNKVLGRFGFSVRKKK